MQLFSYTDEDLDKTFYIVADDNFNAAVCFTSFLIENFREDVRTIPVPVELITVVAEAGTVIESRDL